MTVLESSAGGILTQRTVTAIWLISLHTSLLIASNAGGAKMIGLFGGLAASATVFSYSLTFPICDIVNELFGRGVARLMVNIGLAGLVVSVIFFQFSIWAPPASFWGGQQAYEATLGLGPRILAGGWLSYLVGNHIDVWIFHRLRILTRGRYFWFRKNLSTAVSQAIDTVIFMTVAFAGVFPIFPAIPGQYIIKLTVAISCTPLTYYAIRTTRRVLERPLRANRGIAEV